MRFLDRVKLLIRSTVGSVLYGSPSDPSEVASSWRRDRSLDKAQTHLQILQQDLAQAEKRGDDALAERLRREITELQHLLGKAGARQQAQAGRMLPGASAATPTEHFAEAEGIKDTPNTQQSSEQGLDDTRIADRLREMRERR